MEKKIYKSKRFANDNGTIYSINFSLYGILLYSRSASAYIRQTKSIETIQNTYAKDVPNAVKIAEQLGVSSNEILASGEMIVTFNANGGTVGTKSKKVTYGGTYGKLPVPTREGYTFKGWNNTNSKNLLNLDAIYAQRYNGDVNKTLINFDSSTGIYTCYSNTFHYHVYGYDVMPYVEAGKTYTFSAYIIYPGTSGNVDIAFDTLDNGTRSAHDKVFRNVSIGDRIYYTFTIPASVMRCVVGLNNAGDYDATGLQYNNLQLEEGTEATEYEPYYITSSTKVVQQNNHTLTAIWEENN